MHATHMVLRYPCVRFLPLHEHCRVKWNLFCGAHSIEKRQLAVTKQWPQRIIKDPTVNSFYWNYFHKKKKKEDPYENCRDDAD